MSRATVTRTRPQHRRTAVLGRPGRSPPPGPFDNPSALSAHTKFLRSADIARRFRSVPASASSLRSVRKTVSKALGSASRTEVLTLAHDLIEAGIPRFVAYEIVVNHKSTFESLSRREIEKLAAGIDNWGDIDSFACLLAGPAWRTGLIDDSVVRSWARSKDWCWRRAALVSTVPLNSLAGTGPARPPKRPGTPPVLPAPGSVVPAGSSKARGGQGDPKRTIELCRLLANDRHDMVEKALSWALRELSKRDAASVIKFLNETDNLGARVKREVNNKLTTGLKNPPKQQIANG